MRTNQSCRDLKEYYLGDLWSERVCLRTIHHLLQNDGFLAENELTASIKLVPLDVQEAEQSAGCIAYQSIRRSAKKLMGLFCTFTNSLKCIFRWTPLYLSWIPWKHLGRIYRNAQAM